MSTSTSSASSTAATAKSEIMIWVQLVDSAGSAYDNVNPCYVLAASSGMVADLLVLVQKMFDLPKYLKDVPAAKLRAFVDKDALLSNAELIPPTPVVDLKTSYWQPLLVVVPSSDIYGTFPCTASILIITRNRGS